MRRSDREIKNFSDIVAVLSGCDVVRLGVNDGECPYIVPLNFGMTVEGDTVTLYFHSALEGKKLELLRVAGVAAFEADRAHKLVSDVATGHCTMEYESVMGVGRIEFVPDCEKAAALKLLVDKYHPEGFAFNEAVIPHTAVFKLIVTAMTGKARKVKRA